MYIPSFWDSHVSDAYESGSTRLGKEMSMCKSIYMYMHVHINLYMYVYYM